jgi:hypothetical protein
MITAITTASNGTPSAPSSAQAISDTTIAAISRNTSGSTNWATNRRHRGTSSAASSRLGPSRASRAAASAVSRPRAGSVPRAAATSAASCRQGSTTVGVASATASRA